MSEYRKVVLTVQIVAQEERDKFHALSRPETYHKIRPHEAVGERGCYSVELTPEELTQARRDTLDPDSNLIEVEEPRVMDSHLVPNQGNLDYAGLRRLSEDGYDASGVAVAVIDRGITTAFRDAHFAGRVSATEDFTEEGNPYALYGGDEHGCYMSGLAVPPGADLIVAKVNLTSDVAEAFYWIADSTTAEIVSISLATSTPSTALADAVDYARDAGLLIFASAGNDGNTTVNYPSSYDGAHKISNFDHRTDAISPDSTYGSDVWAAAGGNDHNLWNASGSEIYLEAGGTSCATAMAARIATYVVGKFGAGAAVSRMESMARDAGFASNKQGAGVLRLVHVYEVPDPDGTPTTEDPNPTKEPAIPVVPVGQSRDFDLEFPELPPIEGPGTGTDPSGSGGSSACQTELEGLIDDSNWAGLRDFIEAQTGQGIASAVPEWALVVDDGIARDASIELCGQTVNLSISGTLNDVETCSRPTLTMTLSDNDYSLPTNILGTNESVPTPDPPTLFTDHEYFTTESVPDSTFHADNPRMMWLSNTADSDTLSKWNNLTAYSSEVITDEETYWSVIRINAHYTTKLNHRIQHVYDFEAEEWTEAHIYDYPPPLVGFHVEARSTPGSLVVPADYNGAYNHSVNTWYPTNGWMSENRYPSGLPLNIDGETPEDVTSAVASYNAARTAQDPVITFNEGTLQLTVSYETRQNALYFPWVGCDASQYAAVTVIYGSYNHPMGSAFATPAQPGDPFYPNSDGFLDLVLNRYQDDDPSTGIAQTGFYRLLPDSAGSYSPSLTATTSGPGDGRPPDTTPNPPIVPVGGGCRSSIDGPSSCTWTVPDTGDVPLPGDNFGGYPVFNTKFPKFNIGCHFPDFGNMDPCGPGGGNYGSNGPLPGGRDRGGKRGSGHGSVKTGGLSYGNPRKVTFDELTCPGQDTPSISCFTVITMLLMDCGISPLDIIFQVTSEWDKPFPENKCFKKGSRKWDAAEWTARFLMLDIIDEGKPTNNIYVGPRYHRPDQFTHEFYEHIDFFGYDPVNSSDELYGAVEVFGPNGSSISIVDSPFVTADSPTLLVEAGANYSQDDMDNLAAYKASLIRRDTASVQVVVPYSPDYFLRDKALLHAPDRGFTTTWIIMGKESDVSVSGRLHILTLMLPATVRELDEFPTPVGTVAEEIPGTEFAP